MKRTDQPPATSPPLTLPHLSPRLLWTMTIASAAAVANLYYNQPMLADMMRTLRVTPKEIGLVATFTQVGYALGMPLFIPLADFTERRRLVTILFTVVAFSLLGAAFAPNLVLIVAASFVIGLTTVTAQIMIPLATELASPQEQGKTIGTILSGVLVGVLLARTLSGTIAQHFGWRTMFIVAAVMSAIFGLLLRFELPEVKPRAGVRYPELMRSIGALFLELPKLRQVSFVAAMFFAAFTVFWTTLVFRLETPPYHYGAQAAGLFGIVGAAGVFAAPMAGRMADRHSPRYVAGLAILGVLFSFIVFWLFGARLWGLVIGVVLLDAAVQSAQVANQSRVLSLRPDARNRVNTIYMVSYFGGGSVGSLLGTWAWGRWGWHGVCATGIALMSLAGVAFLLRGPEPAHSRNQQEELAA
jgi:predicted MFS family arabinose efflux permease